MFMFTIYIVYEVNSHVIENELTYGLYGSLKNEEE